MQLQPALPDDQPTWVEVQLDEAADVLRREAFEARPNPGCRICAYRMLCPTQAQGTQVVP